jgi:hypothetical protein
MIYEYEPYREFYPTIQSTLILSKRGMTTLPLIPPSNLNVKAKWDAARLKNGGFAT